MPDFGVIHEQGFPVGENLGFKPLTEAEKKKIEEQIGGKKETTKIEK